MKIKRQSSTPVINDDLHQMNERNDRNSRSFKSSRTRSKSRNGSNLPPDAAEQQVLSHLQRIINSKYTFKKSKKLKALTASPDPHLAASPDIDNDENWSPPPIEPLYKQQSRIRTSSSHFGNLRRLRTNTNSSIDPTAPEPGPPPITQINDDFLSMKRTRSTTMTRQRSESLGMSSPDDSEGSAIAFTRDMDVFEMEVLYENQRGLFLFGTGYFSFKSLLPIDPSPYTNGLGGPSPYTPETIQPPDPLWEWVHPHMLVDMSCRRKRDEAGWEYNTWFKSTGWTQNGGPFSYVRRRRWIRLRKRPANAAPLSQSNTSQHFNSVNSIKTQRRPRSASQIKIPSVHNNAQSPHSLHSPTKSTHSNIAPLEADNSINVMTPPASVFELDGNDEAEYLPVRASDLPAPQPLSTHSLASHSSFIDRTNTQHSHISVADPFLPYPSNATDEDEKVWNEINLRRLARIQSACQLDRERIQLWQCWLALNRTEVLNVIQAQPFKIYALVCYETYRKQLEAMFEKAVKSKERPPPSPFLLTSLEPAPDIPPTLPSVILHTPSNSPGKFRPNLQMSPMNTPIQSRRSSLSIRQ